MSIPRLVLAFLLALMQHPAIAESPGVYASVIAGTVARDDLPPNVSSGIRKNIPRQMRIRDGANLRDFVVASNELHIARQVVAVDAQPDMESLQRLAVALEAIHGKEVGLVLHPSDSAPTPLNRRFLVRARPGSNPTGSIFGYVLARQHARKFLPDDPYFSRQWHLRNTQFNGVDVGVTNIWDTWRGSNVLVGIVDDGVDMAHSDLAANVNAAASWDFNDQDPDPSPRVTGSCYSDLQGANCHGTAVAGLAAARGNNGMGVSGVAFEAQLAGLRLIADPTTDEEEAAAMLHRNDIIAIKNNSWGAADCDFGVYAILDGPGPLMREAVRAGASSGRGGKGVVYTWAGGNGRTCGEDVNYDGYANMVEAIAIGAVTSTGAQAFYSEPCACLVAAAPSDGGGPAITTTDITNEFGYNSGGGGDLSNPSYTSNFNGTSASTPLVSGVVALMLQANPELNYRDVKEILLRSGTKVQSSDPDWQTNSAGIPHNHKFGGGLVNALAAITLATNWVSLGPLTTLSIIETNLAIPIPDGAPAGVTRTFTFTQDWMRVENVAVTLTAPHSRWGELSVTLRSPSGLQSRLATPHNGDPAYSYDAWTFNTVRHWGERAAGQWTVTVADSASGNTGELDALEMTLFVSPPQARLRIEATVEGQHIIVTAPPAGWRYAIESAPTVHAPPMEWTEIGNVTIPPSGQVFLIDPIPLSAQRFYRARLIEQ